MALNIDNTALDDITEVAKTILLLEMVTDPQSEQEIEKFAQDWQKMKIL